MKVQMYRRLLVRGLPGGRKFLDSHGIEYTEIDVDRDREASAEVVRRVGKRAVPQLVIDGEWFQPYKPGRGLLSMSCTSGWGFLAAERLSLVQLRVGSGPRNAALARSLP